MRLNFDRRLLLVIGGGLVVLALSLTVAFWLVRRGDAPPAPPPASVGGLVVQTGQAQDSALDTRAPLRCFVNGQLIGMTTLADCAQRNGVATQALDVGSASGAPPPPSVAGDAAASGQSATLPAAAVGAAPLAAAQPQTLAADGQAPQAVCLRWAAGGWRKLGDTLPLSACVQSALAGACAPGVSLTYARWGGWTLRVGPSRQVEAAADNVDFRPISVAPPAAC
jgi:hypothetical protein